MAAAAAPERQFVLFERGQLRDEILAHFRNGLRKLLNPETNAPFTEREISVATARLSRYFAEADAIDLTNQAQQARGGYFADQAIINRASTPFLGDVHGKQWGESFLPAVGGSGPTTSVAAVGTTFVGSTTLPDPAATYATAPNGDRFQVLFTVTTPANGIAGSDPLSPLLLVGIDTGPDTNLPPGTELTWANAPPGATAPAIVTTLFTGGTAAETDADFAKRLLSRIRHKPASGNNAHFRSWARAASSAVEDAMVYACAFHAGSTLVSILQKRSNIQGPNGRLASVGTLAAATAFLVPPGSPEVPNPPHVVVVPNTHVPSNMTIAIDLPKGKSSGWTDLQPFPGQSAGTPSSVTVVTDQTHFRISSLVALPAGVTQPQMMIWNATISRFEKLNVTSVTSVGGNLYDVVLSAPPATTVAVGSYLSPHMARLQLVGETVEQYFDSLGPGEVIDLSVDLRAHRAYRFPEPNEELPQRAGSSIGSFLRDALGGAVADEDLTAVSVSMPPIPSDPIDGPALLVAGKIGIYPLT